MATIIVVTDFSNTAQNALRYACAFCARSKTIDLLLVNIETVPVSYSGDGVAMAAIADTLAHRVDRLEEEIANAADAGFTGKVRCRAVIGEFLKGLRELIDEEQAALVIMGTPAAYGEVWSWDPNILAALTELPVSVLTVPPNVVYKAVSNICFASIPDVIHNSSSIASLKKIVKYTGATLHVISVVPPHYDEKRDEAAVAELHQQLEEIHPVYHKTYDSHIVQAIGKFVEEYHIDLLVVRPRKHGLWYNLFHKSYARELAKLNLIPVMALHDEWNVG